MSNNYEQLICVTKKKKKTSTKSFSLYLCVQSISCWEHRAEPKFRIAARNCFVYMNNNCKAGVVASHIRSSVHYCAQPFDWHTIALNSILCRCIGPEQYWTWTWNSRFNWTDTITVLYNRCGDDVILANQHQQQHSANIFVCFDLSSRSQTS